MAFTFLIHSIAFLSPLIKDSSEPMWINFKKHQRYLMGLMQWSGSTAYILQLDLQIREHHEGWIAIFQFRALHKFKNHVILHGCKNWLYTVPPRVGWFLKGAATLSLSVSLPLSLSLALCLSLAATCCVLQKKWSWGNQKMTHRAATTSTPCWQLRRRVPREMPGKWGEKQQGWPPLHLELKVCESTRVNATAADAAVVGQEWRKLMSTMVCTSNCVNISVCHSAQAF